MKHMPAIRGALLVAAATLGFATLGTLANVAYDAGMGSATFVALRAALGAVILGALLVIRPARRTSLSLLPARQKSLLVLAIVVNGSFNLALFGAFAVAAVPVVLAIYFTYPGLVAAMSVALGRERLTPVRVAGLSVAVIGALLIVADRLAGAESAPVGLLLAAAAAGLQATYIVVSRAGFPSVPAEQAITLVLVGGFGMAAGTALATQGTAAFAGGWLTDPAPWLAVGAAAVLGTAAAKVWVLQGVRLLGGTRTAVIMLGEPIGGALLAAVVLGQALAATVLAGGGLIVIGALAVQRPAPGRTRTAE